jgi:hypothetical protein
MEGNKAAQHPAVLLVKDIENVEGIPSLTKRIIIFRLRLEAWLAVNKWENVITTNNHAVPEAMWVGCIE